MFLKYSRITYNPTPVREILSKDNCIVCLPIVQWVQLITYSSIRKTITEQFSRREVTALKPFSWLCLAKIKLSAWNNIYCLYLSTSSLNHKQKILLEANLLREVLNNNICCGKDYFICCNAVISKRSSHNQIYPEIEDVAAKSKKIQSSINLSMYKLKLV